MAENILFVGIFLWCHTTTQYNAALTNTLFNQTKQPEKKTPCESYPGRNSMNRFLDEHFCIIPGIMDINEYKFYTLDN